MPTEAIAVAGIVSTAISATVYQPRRPRARESDGQASLFLRKAFHVVSNCPPQLGGWSVSGETFIVKDTKNFSEKVIPTVYKHNNFSSFVRQLNFYGFRKIKSDLSSVENPWWEFRHPKFRRGMPHLLLEIKRVEHCVVQTEPPDLRETNSLKSSVAELQERLALVDKSMIGLTRLVTDIMKYSVYSSTSSSSALSAYDLNELAIGKKRSIDTVDSCSPPKKYHEGQILLSQEVLNSSNKRFEDGEDDDNETFTELLTLSKDGREDVLSIPYFYGSDISGDIDEFLSCSDLLDEEVREGELCSTTAADMITTDECTRSHALSAGKVPLTIHDIPFIMTQLPPSMQIKFIENFSETAGEQYLQTMLMRVASTEGLCEELLLSTHREGIDAVTTANIISKSQCDGETSDTNKL